ESPRERIAQDDPAPVADVERTRRVDAPELHLVGFLLPEPAAPVLGTPACDFAHESAQPGRAEAEVDVAANRLGLGNVQLDRPGHLAGYLVGPPPQDPRQLHPGWRRVVAVDGVARPGQLQVRRLSVGADPPDRRLEGGCHLRLRAGHGQCGWARRKVTSSWLCCARRWMVTVTRWRGRNRVARTWFRGCASSTLTSSTWRSTSPSWMPAWAAGPPVATPVTRLPAGRPRSAASRGARPCLLPPRSGRPRLAPRFTYATSAPTSAPPSARHPTSTSPSAS